MKEPKRYEDLDRNSIINKTCSDLEDIVNNHDPETDVPIDDGIWNRLDKMALEIERHAVSKITCMFPENEQSK